MCSRFSETKDEVKIRVRDLKVAFGVLHSWTDSCACPKFGLPAILTQWQEA